MENFSGWWLKIEKLRLKYRQYGWLCFLFNLSLILLTHKFSLVDMKRCFQYLSIRTGEKKNCNRIDRVHGTNIHFIIIISPNLLAWAKRKEDSHKKETRVGNNEILYHGIKKNNIFFYSSKPLPTYASSFNICEYIFICHQNIIPFERQKKEKMKWDKNNSYKTTFTRASTCTYIKRMYIGSNMLSKVYDYKYGWIQ